MNSLNQNFKLNLQDTAVCNTLYKKLSEQKILSFLVLKDSELIVEYYHDNKVRKNLQNLHSTTKCFASALIGICMDQGLIQDVNTPITEYFGDILKNDPDPRKQDITLYHLLTMSAGFDWPEFGEWNYYAPMNFQNDIIRYILNRDLACAPGESMNYNSGCSHLLGAIIQKVTKTTVLDFAKEYLFHPLGITEYRWVANKGQNKTDDGLRIKTMDMLKFGYLFLNEGKYKNKQIISSEWVKESTKPRYLTYKFIGSYGYQWWSSTLRLNQSDSTSIPFYFALGVMGQFIIVVPDLNVVAAITSRVENTMLPLDIFREMIVDFNSTSN